MARRRNEEAGDFGAEVKHFDKACVCETSDLGKAKSGYSVAGECLSRLQLDGRVARPFKSDTCVAVLFP